MARRKVQYGAGSALAAIILLGILAVVNLFSSGHFVRADLTEKKEFTVTQSTKKVLRNLDDVVNLKVYFTRDLPSHMITFQRQVRDMIDEFVAYAGGDLQVDFIDPAEDPEEEQRVRFLGIPPVQVNVIERDRTSVMNAYLGMAILYEDKKEIIPIVSSVHNLEYDLTAAILRVTATEKKTVGFLTGHGEQSLEESYQVVKGQLEQQYNVVEVKVDAGEPVPSEVNTLVIAGPTSKVTDRSKYEIDQFVMRGGRAIFLVDKIKIQEGTLQATSNDPALDDLLATYGVRVENQMVADRSNSMATFYRQMTGAFGGTMAFTVPYFLWVKALPENISQDNPAVSALETMVIPWTSPVTILRDAPETVEITPLVTSSQFNAVQEHYFELNPEKTPQIAKEPVPKRNLVVLLSGSFPSFFSDKEVPPVQEETEGEGEESEALTPGEEASERETVEQSPETQIVVVGNSKLLEQGFLQQFSVNLTFLLNVVDWMTIGEDLISIRSRVVVDRPLREIGESQKAVVRFIGTFGVSILVVLFGLLRGFARRKSKALGIYSEVGSRP